MTDTHNTAQTNISGQGLPAFPPLPAILIGGPPNAGKSVLTYNLTQELRRRKIPHYVYRAQTDIEGDWFLREKQEQVRSVRFKDFRHWDNEFRDFVCLDLARPRHLPLLVDLGGKPSEKDQCIFQACTRSLLLLKEDEPDLSQTWRDFCKKHIASPIAEVFSERNGTSRLTARRPIITGTITGLERGAQYIYGPVFKALADRVSELFSSYSHDELEKRHRELAPIDNVIHVERDLRELAPGADEWTPNLLGRYLAKLEPREMAVYGRAPNWLYGALALHAPAEAFEQFDVRLGWVSVLALQLKSETVPLSTDLLHIKDPYTDSELYVLDMHPPHNYIDYRDADQLAFPAPPSGKGVIVSGKLPLWLFTALARFYAQLDVPWIALTDAHNNTAVVIYSRVERYRVGNVLRMPV